MDIKEHTAPVSRVGAVGSEGVVVRDLDLGICDVAFEPSFSEG